MSVRLQVALDLMNLQRAVRIAKEAVEGGVDQLEAGTPLIKAEGMEAVRKLREEFPDKTIVADMKTMDVGGVEVEMAAKAGADIVGVLAAADDETIKEAVKAARNYDAEIMADLLRVEEQVERTKEVCSLGVDYVGIHIGIDAQMKGIDPGDLVEEVSKASSVPVAVAGGLTSENVASMVDKGAEVIIVGGGIIKAEDVSGAAEKIKRAIIEGISLESEVMRKSGPEKVKKVLETVSTPNISDAMHREPCMEGIHSLTTEGKKIVGRALTVKTVDGDWAKPVEAIDEAGPNNILVIDADGGRTAVWGELASWSSKQKGVKGIVIDGAVRDVDDIRELDFPVFAKYRASNAGEPKGYGGIDVEIRCGGKTVRPGDWIVGDDSGVMVIPQEESLQIANRAQDVKEKENRIRKEIREGRTLSGVMELKKWEKKEI